MSRLPVEHPAPGVRLYPFADGEFVIADHAGWVEGVFPTRESAIAAATPCNDVCGCLTSGAGE